MNRPSKTRRMMLWRRQCLSFSASLFPAVFFLYFTTFNWNLFSCLSPALGLKHPVHPRNKISSQRSSRTHLAQYSFKALLSQGKNNRFSALYQQFSFRITAEEAASSSPEKFALSNLRSQLFEPRFLLFNLLFQLIIFA